MRAREFTINVPINIKLGDTDETELEVGTPDTANAQPEVRPVEVEPQPNPASSEEDDECGDVMVPPLQQQIELQKANLGKTSEVIDDLTDEDEIDQEKDDKEREPEAPHVDLTGYWDQKPVGR